MKRFVCRLDTRGGDDDDAQLICAALSAVTHLCTISSSSALNLYVRSSPRRMNSHWDVVSMTWCLIGMMPHGALPRLQSCVGAVRAARPATKQRTRVRSQVERCTHANGSS
eukprot:SAG22_NODE_13856_length_392_cov_2.720137_1_plen_110_part_01